MREEPYSHQRLVELVKEYDKHEAFNTKDEAERYSDMQVGNGFKTVGMRLGGQWHVFMKKQDLEIGNKVEDNKIKMVADNTNTNTNYKYIPLSEILEKEPEMEKLGVSEVARSKRGFLTYYKKIGGKKDKVNEEWENRRRGFIARHLAQYKKDHGYRRKLALIAWGL